MSPYYSCFSKSPRRKQAIFHLMTLPLELQALLRNPSQFRYSRVGEESGLVELGDRVPLLHHLDFFVDTQTCVVSCGLLWLRRLRLRSYVAGVEYVLSIKCAIEDRIQLVIVRYVAPRGTICSHAREFSTL